MKIAVVYCYPLVKRPTYLPLAYRFARTWQRFPGHSLHVVFNGWKPQPVESAPFDGMDYEPHVHNNFGWDIGAFQMAAETIPCDLLVCLGAPVHFHVPGWLDRMGDAYVQHGPGLYGCWAYLSPNWHVRTTVIFCPPEIIQSYPNQIGSSKASRYDFEHGPNSLTRHVLSAGLPCIMVTWKGCFPFDQWNDHAPGPADSLVWDQHTHV